jgi:hypothetical protein
MNVPAIRISGLAIGEQGELIEEKRAAIHMVRTTTKDWDEQNYQRMSGNSLTENRWSSIGDRWLRETGKL